MLSCQRISQAERLPTFGQFIEQDVYKQIEARIALLNIQHAKLRKQPSLKECRRLINVCNLLVREYTPLHEQKKTIDKLRIKFTRLSTN